MTRKIFVFALIIVLAMSAASSAEILAGPGIAIATTDSGQLQGFIRNGIYTYHGVQYATAERFMPPTKFPAWEGVRLALNYGTMSPQDTSREGDIFPPHYFWPHWEPRILAQSYNCQNLNIWTPALDDAKRPVMVWLHGGGHMMGAATVEDVYDGENLSRTGNVVVVSVNHRLNVEGFLDLSAYGEKYKDSFNQSTRDIVAALEWVRDNIANFGGDPGNVTVFGQSGGGAKALVLMGTPSAKGLFHKAIIQSGGTEGSGMTLTDKSTSQYVTEITLKNLGISPEELDKLNDVPYAELAAASNKALAQVAEERNIINALGRRSLMWCPVVDGEFIPENPADKKFVDLAKDIPLMVGSVLNEWISMPLLANMAVTQSDNKNNWDDSKVDEMLTAKYGDKAEAVASAFLKAYPYKKKADALYVDTWLRSRAKKVAALKADQNGAPVFAYVFTWETPIMGGYAMAYHCSELPFVFNNIALSEMATGGGEKAQALADVMSRAWVDFARTGNPGWEAYTRDNGATMLFDDEPILTHHHDDELIGILVPDYVY
ncbi:MAG: carboxylesterase/lipase family protein [Synergistaceae bacterium]|nr:carboxylesterase/lipase family protein [Synergistaceae bacterium]